ncbi:MAG: hypothetical protein AB4038_15520 [Prochloraceae cyanobacterium]
MEKPVLNKAKSWGFTTQLGEENNWQILPSQSQEIWQLTEVDSRWILSIKNVPQIYLDSEEAISFLNRRQSSKVDDSNYSFQQGKYETF